MRPSQFIDRQETLVAPKRIARVTVHCAYDGGEMERTRSEVARSGNGLFFHNRTCRARYHGDRRTTSVVVPCAGTTEDGDPCPNTVRQTEAYKRLYCGQGCSGRAARVEKVILHCAGVLPNGEPCPEVIERYPSQVPKTGRAFHSAACRDSGPGTKPRRGETNVPCELGDKCVGPGTFYRPPNSARRFCCVACRQVNERRDKVRFNCEICGEEKVVSRSLFEHNPSRYCSKWCNALGQITRRIDREFNGKPMVQTKDGYILLWMGPNKGWKGEHVWVVEQDLGHPVPKGSEVHHKNEVTDDNRLENLIVLSKEEHARIHGHRKWQRKSALDEVTSQLAAAQARIAELEAAAS